MTKVQMLTTSAGPGGNRNAGSILELPDDEAKALVAGRWARLIEDDKPQPLETATAVTATETATAPSPKKK